jgi:hypothetical protein
LDGESALWDGEEVTLCTGEHAPSAQMNAALADHAAHWAGQIADDLQNFAAVCPDLTFYGPTPPYEPGALPIYYDAMRWADDGGRA